MLCAKFGLYWSSGSGEEDENVKSLRQWKQRQTKDKLWSGKLVLAFSSADLKLHQVSSKLAQWVWRSSLSIGPVVLEKKIFFKFRQCVYPFSLISPLGKGRGTSFEQTCILFTQELVEIGPVVLEKEIFQFRQCIFTISWLQTGGHWRTGIQNSSLE